MEGNMWDYHNMIGFSSNNIYIYLHMNSHFQQLRYDYNSSSQANNI